jgi:hypothetical protein
MRGDPQSTGVRLKRKPRVPGPGSGLYAWLLSQATGVNPPNLKHCSELIAAARIIVSVFGFPSQRA